ncbi:carboxymuconolactone decarboxylase family protein [Streptomyces sp. NBC_01142]|nr:carboxymuconolactone decarboxylase family protein [Streptomyces sp. NBC_01142]
MQPRMENPAFVSPDARTGIGSICNTVNPGGIPPELREIVALRASQINGCSACVYAHVQNLRKAGESDERVAAVATWRQTPFFTDAERAALELAEKATRLSGRSADAVPDELWEQLSAHFDLQQLSVLILLTRVTSMFNCLNAVVRQPVGMSWS